jgi:hypothetical protein
MSMVSSFDPQPPPPVPLPAIKFADAQRLPAHSGLPVRQGLAAPQVSPAPQTDALRQALTAATDDAVVRDLLYLEAWEREPIPGAGAALRINQIRRANPELAAAIRAELKKPAPWLTPSLPIAP